MASDTWTLTYSGSVVASLEEVRRNGEWWNGWVSGSGKMFENVRSLWRGVEHARDREDTEEEKRLLARWNTEAWNLCNGQGESVALETFHFYSGGLCAFRLHPPAVEEERDRDTR